MTRPTKSVRKKVSPQKKEKQGSVATRRLLSADIPGSKAGEWDRGLVLRETFLMYLSEDPADFHRWLSRRYFAWLCEKNVPVEPCYRSSRAKGLLHAALLDLRYIAEFLAYTARESVEADEDSRLEVEHGWFADSLAMEVQGLVDRIDERIHAGKRTKRNV